MKYGKLILLTMIAGSLTACSSWPNSERAASRSQMPPLSKQVPSESVGYPRGVNVGQEGNAYAVPGDATSSQSSANLAPPGSSLQQMTQQNQTSMAEPQPQRMQAQVSNTGSGISTNMSYSQAWSKVGKALPSSGYPIMEQDNSTGTYYVLDKSSTGGLIKRDTPIYQVRVQRSGEGTNINVLNAQNQPANGAVSSKILGALKGQM